MIFRANETLSLGEHHTPLGEQPRFEKSQIRPNNHLTALKHVTVVGRMSALAGRVSQFPPISNSIFFYSRSLFVG